MTREQAVAAAKEICACMRFDFDRSGVGEALRRLIDQLYPPVK